MYQIVIRDISYILGIDGSLQDMTTNAYATLHAQLQCIRSVVPFLASGGNLSDRNFINLVAQLIYSCFFCVYEAGAPHAAHAWPVLK